MAFLLLGLLLLCGGQLVVHAMDASAMGRVAQVDKLARGLAKRNLFAGMAYVGVGGRAALSKGYGYASPELAAKMRADHRFGIGSNTKLFTAVSIWQLHVAGKLDVNSTVDSFLDMRDYGLATERWCPTVLNDTTGACQPATLVQLMSMQSGLIDTDNCRYPSDAWQIEYCSGNAKGVNLTELQLARLASGSVSLTELLTISNIFTLPLQQPPGAGYQYVNQNFLILAAVLEKVSNLTTQQYFERHLFQPAGLADTLFDLSNGNDGVVAGMLYPPQYNAQLYPTSALGSNSELGASSSDSISTGVAGDGDVTPKLAGVGSAQGAPRGTTVKIYRRQGVYNAVIWNLVHAEGGIISTHRDMARWFRTLTRDPQALGLTPASIRDIFTRGIPLSPEPGALTYAQGILTRPDATHPLGSRVLFYEGNIGYSSVTYLDLDPTDPAMDVHVATLTFLAPSFSPFVLNLVPDAHPSKHTGTALERELNNPSDGQTVCMMGLGDDPAQGAGTAGLPARRKAAAGAVAAAAAGQAAVPVPHILCDIADAGVDVLLTAQFANAQLGRSWF